MVIRVVIKCSIISYFKAQRHHVGNDVHRFNLRVGIAHVLFELNVKFLQTVIFQFLIHPRI
jgi:hypothetical protein